MIFFLDGPAHPLLKTKDKDKEALKLLCLVFRELEQPLSWQLLTYFQVILLGLESYKAKKIIPQDPQTQSVQLPQSNVTW